MAGEGQQQVDMFSADFEVGDDDVNNNEPGVVVAFEDDGNAKVIKPDGQQVTPRADTSTQSTGADADPVDDLKGQFAAMQQRATSAEREAAAERQRADEASRRLHHAEGSVMSGQLDTVTSGLQAAEQALKAAKGQLVAANESGDHATAADIQGDIGIITARIVRLQEAKADIEDSLKSRPREPMQPQRRAPAQQQPADQVEAFIQQNGMSQRSADFIRKNPTMATNPKVFQRALAAHNLALAEDIELESDEYFQRISEGIGVTQKKPEPAPQPQQQRRPSAPAAPAGGGGGGGGGAALQGGTQVQLTRGEAKSATDGTLVWNYDDPSGKNAFKKGDPIGLAEMARRKHLGQKAGLYDKNNIEA